MNAYQVDLLLLSARAVDLFDDLYRWQSEYKIKIKELPQEEKPLIWLPTSGNSRLSSAKRKSEKKVLDIYPIMNYNRLKLTELYK
ncbi:hypothetical protein ES705_09748 [subsurface metagenome]